VRDIATGRTVVVKLLNAGRDWPGLEARFEAEQNAVAQLVGHPNIVPVYGHGWTETGMPYVVSGEETGGSIGDRLRGPTPMTGPDILALGVRLAGALESAHRAGVIHGDLRPDDMMLTPDGEPLLADFGLVTLVRPSTSEVSDPQELAHVAPELLDGQPPTPASDIYALASALYTLLAGEPAYVHRNDTSVIPVIMRIASDPLPDLTAKSVPPSVAEVVSKAMSKAPADRYKTAQDLGRALQQSQVALGLPMTDMTLLGAAATTATGAATKTSAWEGTHDIRTGAAAATGAAAGAAVGAAAAGGTGGAAGGPPTGPGGAGGPGGPGATPAKSRAPLYIALAVAAVVIIGAVIFFATRDSGSNKNNVAATESSDRKESDKSTDKSTDSTDSTDESSDSTDSTDFTDIGADTVALVNDGGQLTVTVPSTWSSTNTAQLPNGVPTLQASTDLTEFFAGTYLEPGIDSAAFSPAQFDPNNLDAALDAIETFDRTGGSLAAACTPGVREDFVTLASGLTARRELLTACNGGGDVLVLTATNAGIGSFVLGVEIHFGNPPDDPGAQQALDTVDVLKFP
jgi:hypothetical protein